MIASPALHFKVHNSGINDLPPGLPGVTVLRHVEQAFPDGASPALVVVQASDTTSPAVTGAISELRKEALATAWDASR